ncbi:MbcA/ParS/Xre antitoxin family protein [Alteromonas sp. McT4-15]|uniref:antitoxin Xre/MbcA/ParS toxin-binding domain-containing protein n=1 Tax=Alteromonas sp. McT4-15 TaxID=2881256 RepID=UPI001CF8720E|nr:antitoxin Xre/MbcA/ParS toxin-binding domain-containing protein [Alteromonas sp. McT4-15]MCB4438265.1 MbcA/ParS/Xre antitoxin family protein [Alteromonas sp. McT4-15]
MTDIETMCQRVLDNPDFEPNELELALACQSTLSSNHVIALNKVIPENLISEVVLTGPQQLSSISDLQLSSRQNEAIFMLCKIWSMLLHHFNKREDIAIRWLKQPKRPLAGQYPINLMQSNAGSEAVLGLIERLNTGDFS